MDKAASDHTDIMVDILQITYLCVHGRPLPFMTDSAQCANVMNTIGPYSSKQVVQDIIDVSAATVTQIMSNANV